MKTLELEDAELLIIREALDLSVDGYCEMLSRGSDNTILDDLIQFADTIYVYNKIYDITDNLAV